MEKNQLNEFVEKAKALINAPTCSSEAKDAAQQWLNALGTEREKDETIKFIKELEEDIMPIESLISFAESKEGAAYFGGDAPNIAAHAKEINKNGGIYCDCPACAAAAEILKHKEELLG